MEKRQRIQGLSENTQRTLEEEYARREKEAGVSDDRSPEPGGVIPPKSKIIMPSLEGLRAKAAGRSGEQLALKEKSLEDFIDNWRRENPNRELTHLPYTVDVKPVGEAEDLPIEFLYFLINEAVQSDMEDGLRHYFWSILRNLKQIKIYTTSGKITIGLMDPDNNLVRLYFYNKPPFEFYKIE